ncbi:Glutathione S-transferase/chloride channel, C-terminal [Penicillium italicum]|uniref:Glutathione S-transferase/chloride channel, C-terminal n=1 Tax=Penicillium italicum TaxID=40296 RepID=A0A0A2L9S6_PENIT|nr:Glutathione S-transferase/chloride channel, C-terminal [Penicillium italicum]
MPLTIHHLGRSQSERIVWLAEELGIKYDFVFHKRDPILAPQSLRDLHPSGTAPVIEDDNSPFTKNKVVIAESGAIIDYLAGNDITAADIMAICTLTTIRGFCPVEFDEQKHNNILAYLKRVGERPAYQKAMKICEGEDFVPLLGAKAEQFVFPY